MFISNCFLFHNLFFNTRVFFGSCSCKKEQLFSGEVKFSAVPENRTSWVISQLLSKRENIKNEQ